MNNWSKYTSILLAFLLLSGSSGWYAAPADRLTLPLQPLLLQMAATQPEQQVHVIVQKTATQADVEAQVAASQHLKITTLSEYGKQQLQLWLPRWAAV